MVEIARSWSFKLNTGNYQSVDFFCSQKAECKASEAEKVSEALYQFCKASVMRDVNDYKREMLGMGTAEVITSAPDKKSSSLPKEKTGSYKERSPEQSQKRAEKLEVKEESKNTAEIDLGNEALEEKVAEILAE